jgi:hypothetical protein
MERDRWEYLGIGGMIILKLILEKHDGSGMGWINLVQDTDQWRALVNMVMNLLLGNS